MPYAADGRNRDEGVSDGRRPDRQRGVTSLSQLTLAGPVLGAGTLLLLVAGWRRWRPPLLVAVLVALALRIAVAAVAVRYAHPYDFDRDFPRAGHYVRHHQDSLALFSGHRWHWLPPLAYVFALGTKVGDLTGLDWKVVGRGAPIIADIIVLLLVARLAAPGERRLRALQYAGNPVAILVCGWHGQVESITLALALPAFLSAARGHSGRAGAWLGLAVAAQSWPLLLAPGLLIGARRRLPMAIGILGVPALFFLTLPLTFGTPWSKLPADIRPLLDVRPAGAFWGWRGVLDVLGGPSYPAVAARVALIVVLVAVGWACWHWRHATHIDRGAAALMAEMIVAPRFGQQYLIWPMPLLVARPTPTTPLLIIAAGAWAGTAYLHPSGGTTKTVWELGSLLVIALMATSAAWRRTRAAGQSARYTRTSQPASLR